MQTANAEHPTREEWTQRQAAMPEPMKRLIVQHCEKLNAERDAQIAREVARAEALRARLEAFEDALREVIGGETWLEQYRDPNPPEINNAFTEHHQMWWACFDLAAIGAAKVWVMVPYSPGDDVWHASQAEISVQTTRGGVRCPDLAAAMYLAAQYCHAPF